MGEGHHHHHRFLLHQPRSIPSSSRLPKGGGEIVEVEGGHIVRSTGRKDRHSKVCTAKGPRDRRVRLSAHTAIQFYDVQDRLGYDRPSKAVDWLIKNAKAAIDELAKLPPWHPTADPSPPAPEQRTQNHETETSDPTAYAFGGSSSSFLPPSLDSDSIADTIKSFFPITGAAASSSSSPIGFHAQDLRLSLQSFQDPILLHHHHNQPSTTRTRTGEQTFFSTSNTPLVYDTTTSTSWSEQHTRMVPWSTSADTAGGNGEGRGGYAYNLPPPSNEPPQGMPLHSMVGQSLFLSQRGPLQSSNPPSTRAWMDPTTTATGFASGGFSGFRIPARIQGEEEHDGVSDKPSSASRC